MKTNNDTVKLIKGAIIALGIYTGSFLIGVGILIWVGVKS